MKTYKEFFNEAKERQISAEEYKENGGNKNSTQWTTGSIGNLKYWTRRPIKK